MKTPALVLAALLCACTSSSDQKITKSDSMPPAMKEMSLELTDAAPPSIDAGTLCSVPAQLDTDLTSAAQAAVISLSGINPINCPEVSMVETWGGGKLIYSDSPEKPTTRGKLYEDMTLAATSGSVYNRVFLYHVNGYSKNKAKFTVLLKNRGSSSGVFTVQKKGTAGPSTAYAYTGKLGFERWLNSTAGSGQNVAAGAWVSFDTTFDSTQATVNYLMHGIFDYSFTQDHTITICVINATDNPISVCPGLALLSRDTHQRGTFPSADKIYDTAVGVEINTLGEIQQFPIAGGTTNDSNAVGVDVTDNTPMTLAGNYGILYKMHLNVVYGDSHNMGFLFNPRGGGWGGAVWAMPGLLAGGKFLIPAGTGTTSDNTKGSVEGKYSSAQSDPWLQFMPTGGSSFPLRFVAVPF